MIISNPINLDDEMMQCMVECDNGDVTVHTFSTINDLYAFIADSVKGTYQNDNRIAAGRSHGIFSGYLASDDRHRARHGTKVGGRIMYGHV